MFWGSDAQHGEYNEQHCVTYWKGAKILNAVITQNVICEVLEVLTLLW